MVELNIAPQIIDSYACVLLNFFFMPIGNFHSICIYNDMFIEDNWYIIYVHNFI